MIRMLNNNLLCIEVNDNEDENNSGFITPDEDKRFKKLEVMHSSEDDIPKGCIIVVGINSGETHIDKELVYTNVRRGDIIWID